MWGLVVVSLSFCFGNIQSSCRNGHKAVIPIRIFAGMAACFRLISKKSISNLKLNFVNADESAAMCGAGQLTLTHEELYRDHDRNSATPEVSKSETDLALILIKSLLVCQGSNANDLQNLTMTMLPKGRLLSNQGIIVLEGTATDMIFLQGSSRNLHAELAAKMQCDQYKVASADSNGFLVQCKTKQETYLVTPQQQNGEFVLNVRYNSEVDF
jgi:hypothetical protein